jgi:CheY-like chemotaxis protein
VARVAAVIPDLLFGSRVQSALEAAGHEVELLPREPAGPEEVAGAGVLVVDLTSPELDGAALVERLAADGALTGIKVLGFFAHVEPAVRDRALAAGFDQVVPRSRMNREGAELVGRLAARGTR